MINYVRFREEDHSYHNSFGVRYLSATQILGLYKQPFDGPYWSLYKAIEEFLLTNGLKSKWWPFLKSGVDRSNRDADNLLENLKRDLPSYVPYVLSVQQIILRRWDEKRDLSCERGTAYHLFREQQAYARGEQTLAGTEISGLTGQSYSFNLADLADGYHAELLVYNHEYQIAGQIDRAWITTQAITLAEVTPQNLHRVHWIEGVPHLRYVDLDDFKTNGKIKESNKYQKMKDPLGALDDCNYNHYVLQISLYGWILEQFGFTVRSTRFTWVKALLDPMGQEIIDPQTGVFHCEEIPFVFAYHNQEIQSMLDHYKLHNIPVWPC